ncbi:MAG: hypothetical protein U9Q69_00570 [Nanoarchaeota archaeon]|nr:hypothetical protein [Nanoarchaeota archaeon]
MAKKEILITYENLYDLLRREKSKFELQKLNATFFNEVIEYLNNKKAILVSQEKKDNIFASSEIDKTRTQFRNIQKILKKLYEKRESKIVQQALLSSRNDGNGHDTASMLPEEQTFFFSVLTNLNDYRQNILHNLFKCSMPKVEKPKGLKRASEVDDNIIEVLMVDDVPEFVGTDLNVYGPYAKDNAVKLPKDMAENLIKNKQAQKK